MAKDNIYYLNDMIFFGKHARKTINQIWSTDPGWITWAVKNSIIVVKQELRPDKPKEEEEQDPIFLESILRWKNKVNEYEFRECPF